MRVRVRVGVRLRVRVRVRVSHLPRHLARLAVGTMSLGVGVDHRGDN